MDTDVPNFGVRVMPSGVRSYFVRFRIGGGRAAASKRYTLGRHPIVTPEQARQSAKNILAKARLGEDPNLEKSRRRASLTVAQLVSEWIAGPGMRTRRGKPKSAASFLSDKNRLEQHVAPIIGRVKLCDLKRSHVENVRDAITNGDTARPRERTKVRGFREVRGGEGAATRAVACLSTLLGYAVEQGFLPHNPALGVHKAPGKRCERFLSLAEIGAVQAALAQHQDDHPHAVRILTLLLLTGCRRSEIERLTWAEVDLGSKSIMLSQSKTGPRVVYLSDAAATVLAKAPCAEGREFVFPATRGVGHYQGTPKVWRSILNAAALSGVRIHDLRHTFASTALAQGSSLELIAKLLGHKEIRTTQRYAHLADGAVRDAANQACRAITRQYSPQLAVV